MSKVLLWLFGVLLGSFSNSISYAQTTLTKFKSFDISNMSGEVLNLTSSKVRLLDSTAYISLQKSKQNAFFNRYNLMNENIRSRFMNDFSSTLNTARSKLLGNEVIFKIDPNVVGNFGNDAIRKNIGLSSSKYIENLMAPAIRAGFSDYLLEKAKEKFATLLNENEKIDDFINYSLSYLKNSNFSLNTETSLSQIEVALNEVLAIPDIANKTLYEGFKQDLCKKVLNKITAQIPNEIETLSIEQLKSSLKKKYTTFYDDIKSSIEGSINQLGGYLNELSANESKVQESINAISQEWKEVDTKIKNLELQLSSPILGIEEKLKVQAEHARLVAQNYLKLEIVNKYLNYGAKALNLIQDFKSGVYEKVFNSEERNKLLSNLKSFDLPTISETIQGIAIASDFLSRQFPNSKAVKEVSKFINYAVAAISVGKGVAELFSGNPMGVLSMLSGLKSLFGGAPQESPEMQMMKQMMDYMQKSFNAVFDHLEFIEKQLENLTVIVQDMYRDMIRSFQVISDQLNRIEGRERVLDQRTKEILYRQFRNCEQLERIRLTMLDTDSDFLKKYDDYSILYSSPSCAPCLKELFTSAIRENLKEFSAVSTTQLWDLSTIEVDTIYIPTKNLFRALYKDNLSDAIKALTIPAKSLAESNKIFSEIVRSQSASSINLEGILNVYYDYNMLSKLANLLTTYSTFLEIGDQEYHPKKLSIYLSTLPNELRIKRIDLIDRLTAVLELINSSIAQQSLMSGNLLIEGTYQTLLGVNPNNENIDLAIQVLKSNKLFAKNFASRLIFSSINSRIVEDKARYALYSNLFYEAKASEEKRQELNSEFGNSSMQFVYKKEFNNIFVEINTRGKKFEIAAPEPSFILSNEFVQSDALHILLKAKDKMVAKLIDITFLSNYQSSQGILVSDLKYLFDPF